MFFHLRTPLEHVLHLNLRLMLNVLLPLSPSPLTDPTPVPLGLQFLEPWAANPVAPPHLHHYGNNNKQYHENCHHFIFSTQQQSVVGSLMYCAQFQNTPAAECRDGLYTQDVYHILLFSSLVPLPFPETIFIFLCVDPRIVVL